MENCIILTAAQIDIAENAKAPGIALDPIKLTDGTFALPADVLTLPFSDAVIAALSALPSRAVARNELQWVADQALIKLPGLPK